MKKYIALLVITLLSFSFTIPSENTNLQPLNEDCFWSCVSVYSHTECSEIMGQIQCVEVYDVVCSQYCL